MDDRVVKEPQNSQHQIIDGKNAQGPSAHEIQVGLAKRSVSGVEQNRCDEITTDHKKQFYSVITRGNSMEKERSKMVAKDQGDCYKT